MAVGMVDVTMPQMGVSVAEGTLVEWKKQVGDTVERDEIICAISTDKIDTDVESPATGRVAEILVQVDETVEVGVVLARISTDGGEVDTGQSASSAEKTSGASGGDERGQGEASADRVSVARGNEKRASDGVTEEASGEEAEGEPAVAQAGPGAPAPTDAGSGSRTSPTTSQRRYSPVVTRMAAEHGLNLDEIPGTGREGRVRKQDVLAALENKSAAPSTAASEEPPLHIESPYRPEPSAGEPSRKPAAPAPAAAESPTGAVRESGPLSRMRKAIGQHMHDSLQTAATCTTVAEVDLTNIEIARKKFGFSYLPFIARATIEALREFPQLNATLEGETFTIYEDINLGIAVSLGDRGLIVPVIHQAQNYSVEGLAAKLKELASKARNNELQPDEVRGATFTITNPGQFGAIIATPIINLPQVAILDTEAVIKRPVVITDEDGQDAIAIRSMSYLCLSWDHRALDGAAAAQFLSALKKHLER